MLANFGALTTAVSDFASFFTVPSIGALYSPSPSTDKEVVSAFFTKLTDFFKIGIPIYPDKYEEIGGNNIGEQVLVGGVGDDETEGGSKPGDQVVGALTKIADNIVVTPRLWRIHGYIGFKLDNNIGVGLQRPAIELPVPALSNFLMTFGRDVLNDLMKRTVRFISESRRPFRFNTKDGDTVPCLLKSYTFKNEATNLNFIEVDLEIQEFRFIAITTKEGDQKAVGGVNGIYKSGIAMARNMGTMAMRAIL